MSVRRFSNVSSPKNSTRRVIRPWHSSLALVSLLAACAPAPQTPTAEGTPLPDITADPIEPANRVMSGVNYGLLVGVIQPTGRAYRAVVRPPVRKSISKFGRNVTYPGRLANNLLQGRWEGAGDETLRFLTNTTVGLAGFFDPATKWGIPKSDASFAQTFSGWGWKPNTFLMLPLVGPSDDLHATGRGADSLANPLNYQEPLPLVSAAINFNDMSEVSEDIIRFVKTEADPYTSTKYVWTYASKEEAPDWTKHGEIDPATLETFGVATIKTRDPEFASYTRERSARVPTTGRNVKYNLWLQDGPAPLAYITPGLSSHRLSPINMSLAEALYQDGFSVVTTTGLFHPEFMEHASTVSLPGYTPVDNQDLLVSLTAIDRDLTDKYGERFGKRALVGCSMGAFQTLYLAAREKKTGSDMVRFDRYVAVDTPVNLFNGIGNVDRFFNAPMAWPAEIRQERINNTVHKAAKLAQAPPDVQDTKVLPFDAIESQYMVGLSFRLTLRDALYSSQSRENMGVIQTPINPWKREPVYRELFGYSFQDYFTKFALPYYKSRGVDAAKFRREADLKNFRGGLQSNPKVRVIVNANDFLLGPGDVSWLKSTVGSSRVTVFPNGGHLGNVGTPPVQQAVIKAVSGLK